MERPFRRSQVRQVLRYLRMTRPESFPAELTRLLGSGRIRFHLKAVAIDLLGQIDDPRPEEWNPLADLIEAGQPGVQRRLLKLVRGRAQWFKLAAESGFITRWLELRTPSTRTASPRSCRPSNERVPTS